MSEAGTKVDKYRALSGRTDRTLRGEEIIKVSQYLDTQTAPHFMKVEEAAAVRGPIHKANFWLEIWPENWLEITF